MDSIYYQWMDKPVMFILPSSTGFLSLGDPGVGIGRLVHKRRSGLEMLLFMAYASCKAELPMSTLLECLRGKEPKKVEKK